MSSGSAARPSGAAPGTSRPASRPASQRVDRPRRHRVHADFRPERPRQRLRHAVQRRLARGIGDRTPLPREPRHARHVHHVPLRRPQVRHRGPRAVERPFTFTWKISSQISSVSASRSVWAMKCVIPALFTRTSRPTERRRSCARPWSSPAPRPRRSPCRAARDAARLDQAQSFLRVGLGLRVVDDDGEPELREPDGARRGRRRWRCR